MNYETPYYPADVMALMGTKHMDTLRRKIKEGKIPPPDVQLSQKIRYWHQATLVKAGLLAAKRVK